MEDLDIDQLKKDLDEILELSSQQANEVAQTQNDDSGALNKTRDTTAVSDPENTQHFLKVHSLNDEESVEAQNRQSEEKRRTISVTFNEEPEIHIRSQTTIQSATGGVIASRPEINEFGGVSEFTQTGVSLMYAAVESPKEEALRHRTSSQSDHASSVLRVDRSTETSGNEQLHPVNVQQVKPSQDYKDQQHQLAREGESAMLDDIVSLQFQHIPQNPVAFSMLPEDEFIRPGIHAEKLLFGPQNETPRNDDSIGFRNSPELDAREQNACPHENRCFAPPVARQCHCAAYQQEQQYQQQLDHQYQLRLDQQYQLRLDQKYQQQLYQQDQPQQMRQCRYNHPTYQDNQLEYSARENFAAPSDRQELQFTRQAAVEPLFDNDLGNRTYMDQRSLHGGTRAQPTGYPERQNFTSPEIYTQTPARPVMVEPRNEMDNYNRFAIDHQPMQSRVGIPETYRQPMRYPELENFITPSVRVPEVMRDAIVSPLVARDHCQRSVMAQRVMHGGVENTEVYQQQMEYPLRDDFKLPEIEEKLLPAPAQDEPLVEMDECKRSAANLGLMQDEAEVRVSRSREQRNFSIISTNSGTTFHNDLEDASFVVEPSTEALADSIRDPGAGNVDFDFYPPLDQRSPIRVNVGSKVFMGEDIQRVPEVQPGVAVGTIPPEFHNSKSVKLAAHEEFVVADSPAQTDKLAKTSLEDMVTLTEALTRNRDELQELNDEGVLLESKSKQDAKVSFAAPVDEGNAADCPPCVPYKGYAGPVVSHMQGRNCMCIGVDEAMAPAIDKRTLGSSSSQRDEENIVTMRVDGVTTFFQDDDPLPITPYGSTSKLSQKRSKSNISVNKLASDADSVPLPVGAFGNSADLDKKPSKTSICKLPSNVALDEPIDFSMNNAILMRDQENINLMSNAGQLLSYSARNEEHHDPTISEVNQMIYEAPPQQCHDPCKLAIPTLIKSRDANFEFIEQADALTYNRHALSDPAFQNHPQPVHDNYDSFNSLQATYDAPSNRSTLKRGMAMKNLSRIDENEAAACSPGRRNCQCEKRLLEADEQKMNFKFAPVPSGVSVLKFIDRKLMESPVGHPYGLHPESQHVQYDHNDTVQETYQNDYYWSQTGQQQTYAVAPNQNLPCSTSMTAVCSFTQMPQNDQNSCYYQPDGAGRSRSAVEDDDGYMNLPRQGVSHVESSAWVDENEMFLVAQQPSLHYRTPLGLGYRDNAAGYRDNSGYHDNAGYPTTNGYILDIEHPNGPHYSNNAGEVPLARGNPKPDTTFRKCKCAFKRLSKIFRRD